MSLRNIFRKIRDGRFPYRPLVEVVIHKDNLLHNLRVFEEAYPDVAIAPVLKANAYGHGLRDVASVFEHERNIPFFVIDSYHEALILRNEGINKPLVLLGYVPVENIVDSRLAQVSFGITSMDQLKAIAEQLDRAQAFHLKVDTGMHRQGISPDDIEEASNIVMSNSNISIVGLCSHFADADGEDESFSKSQLSQWKNVVEKSKQMFSDIEHYHLANTAGTHLDEYSNVARVGIGLYGIDTQARRNLSLKSVLEMCTVISGVKKLQTGDTVGYNNTFVASRDITIATIPVGYYEGVDRRLSDNGSVFVRGKQCAIVGRVSMNITTIDVSDIPDVKLDDSVLIISVDKNQKNSVESIAKNTDVLPYEVLVRIPSTLRRVVV